MSEMVERVARIIARAHGGTDEAEAAWPMVSGVARAAIEAMREPTSEMAKAGAAIECGTSGNYLLSWRDMIDEAMK